VVGELPAVDADEVALLRAAHNLRPGADLPEQRVAGAPAQTLEVEASVSEAAEGVGRP
jgi:hypothetical protein